MTLPFGYSHHLMIALRGATMPDLARSSQKASSRYAISVVDLGSMSVGQATQCRRRDDVGATPCGGPGAPFTSAVQEYAALKRRSQGAPLPRQCCSADARSTQVARTTQGDAEAT